MKKVAQLLQGTLLLKASCCGHLLSRAGTLFYKA